MSEFKPENHDWSDDDLVDYELQAASHEGRNISDETARVIASQWDSPGSPAIHTFVTTGQIIAPNFFYEVNHEWSESIDKVHRERLEELGAYAAERESPAPVEGWSSKWLKPPGQEAVSDDRCAACGAHVAEPHSPVCPLDRPSEDTPKIVTVADAAKAVAENIRMLVAEKMWLSIEPVPTTPYEEDERREKFNAHYVGFFKTLTDYASYIKHNARDQVEYNDWVIMHHWVVRPEGIYVFIGLSYPQD